MHKMILGAGVLVTGALAASALGAATAGAARSAAGRSARVELRATRLGKLLVDGNGRTLYAFTRDSRRKDVCVRIPGCPGTWPTLRTSGPPIAGKGVKRSLLGTIRVGDHLQVVYAGHPLYTYTGDFAAAQTTYVGARQFGGRWYALTASGKLIR